MESNKSENLEKYLEGLLSDRELEEFERAIENDADLKAEIDLHKDIDAVFMQDEDVRELRKTIRAIDKRHSRKGFDFSQRSFWYQFAMAASIMIVAGSMVFYSYQQNTPDRIFKKYYQPLEAEGIVRSTNPVQNELFLLALQRYQEQNFVEAAQLFEELVKKGATNPQLQLYSGISNMEIENYDKADESFNKIIKQKDNVYVEHAEWYLALCYLRLNEITAAIEAFRHISESSSAYKEKARLIYRKLS